MPNTTLHYRVSAISGEGASDPSGAANAITDDDDPQVTVSFGEATYTVAEGETQSVMVTLSADPERTVVIPLTVTPQGGAAPADYTVPTSVTFDAGDISKSFTFEAIQDDVDDDGERVLLAFGTLPSRVSAGTTATVSITDDDDPQVTVMFGEATYTVAEGAEQLVTVTLSADPERTVTIPLTVTPQGGAAPADYTVPTSVTFDAGDISKSFTFEAIQDDVDDDGESVLLSFGTLPGGVSAGRTAETRVSITDDDDPQVTVSFGAGAYTVAEGAEQLVTVTLSADPERTVVIPLTHTPQSGADTTDYSGVPASVTFNAGQMSQTVTFTAAQDTDDDDDERVLLAFGTLPSRVSAGTTATVSITDDDDPQVTVSFGASAYTVAEGAEQLVTVTLSADPERTVVIPITHMPQDGADTTDYSGVPTSVTFNAGDMSKTIAFEAIQDDVDDDGERVLLAFGTLPGGVSAGTTAETRVSITDDDDPQVTVSFGASAYTVAEGETQSVMVTLSADPERTVVIPLTAVDQGTATSADYSGVPANVTFNAGDMSKTIAFTATADDASDTGESVKISFGTSLPSRVTEGTPNEATVTIKQVSTQFDLDCSQTATVWCADLGLSDRVAENYGWLYMRYGDGWDPPASLSDDDFTFRGVRYAVHSMELRPGTHPALPNAWSRWQQGYSLFRINIYSDHALRNGPPRGHYQDWVLHLDGLELPFKDALQDGGGFVWVGVEIQQLFNDWTPSTVNKIGIEEVAAADQDTNPLLP